MACPGNASADPNFDPPLKAQAFYGLEPFSDLLSGLEEPFQGFSLLSDVKATQGRALRSLLLLLCQAIAVAARIHHEGFGSAIRSFVDSKRRVLLGQAFMFCR